MQLFSTNQKAKNVSFKEAVFKGLPEDNGLYMPLTIPKLPSDFFAKLGKLTIAEIGQEVTKAFVSDEIAAADIDNLLNDAMDFPAPLVEISPSVYSLELFHGPTLAFKDFGARFMSRIMGHFLQHEKRTINILVATSGDTGSAVAQGFFNVPGITVTILYPKGKVSFVQEQQLTTNGGNITALEVDGTFDDCQKLVKMAFLDQEINAKMNLSSANSINIARLIPQSFYYFYAYGQLNLKKDKEIIFCTPSGNFGNICGGLIANAMGLPVKQFIAATNSNDIVPKYLQTGNFEPKPSVATVANAMDVGNPSNFPRLLQLFDNQYDAVVKLISGATYDDADIKKTIQRVYADYGYTLCPHSAIGYQALVDNQQRTDTSTKGVFLATAHPAKFADIVKDATKEDVAMPPRLAELVNRKKEVISMSTKFEDFKDWLMSL
jgi:threonine synthase